MNQSLDDLKTQMGFTPEDWAKIITKKITDENPQSPEQAERIYAEVIAAAVEVEYLKSNSASGT